MPVGTLGTVKALSPEELVQCGAQIILGNTYHLYLRPGCEVIEHFSGLHRFMNWDGPILTDSGGFQVFSLAQLSKVSEEGVAFQSHIDGSSHLLSPEKTVAIQVCLDADIIMCLDQCIAYPAERETAREALELTARWAGRCKKEWQSRTDGHQALFGIVQGGMFRELRARSAGLTAEIGFDGYAVGGLSVGEPKAQMLEIADQTLPLLPVSQPKYVMGVGTPEDLVELVALLPELVATEALAIPLQLKAIVVQVAVVAASATEALAMRSMALNTEDKVALGLLGLLRKQQKSSTITSIEQMSPWARPPIGLRYMGPATCWLSITTLRPTQRAPTILP